MTHIIIAVTGCTLLFSGIIGLNLLLSGAMVRDVYLNGSFMPTLELIERTKSIWALKVDLILVGLSILLIVISLWLAKKGHR